MTVKNINTNTNTTDSERAVYAYEYLRLQHSAVKLTSLTKKETVATEKKNLFAASHTIGFSAFI